MNIKALVFDFFGVVQVSDRLDQELLDYILELKKSYKTAMLSNAVRFDDYADREYLKTYFDVIAISEEIGHAKPDNQAYMYVLQKFGLQANETVFIDDTPNWCAAAEALGMQAITYGDVKTLKRTLKSYI